MSKEAYAIKSFDAFVLLKKASVYIHIKSLNKAMNFYQK